jgi:hypothetical protein
MRFGPSADYVAPDVAYPGDTFQLLGRNFGGDWVQVQRNDSRAVWLPLERVDVGDMDVMTLPLARPTHER